MSVTHMLCTVDERVMTVDVDQLSQRRIVVDSSRVPSIFLLLKGNHYE